MKGKGICLQTDYSILQTVIKEFERGCELIDRLDDLTYRRSANGTGSVGGHFRHNLDFVNSFLKGIGDGQIDYNARERDVRVEIDRRYAVGKFEIAMKRLGSLTVEIMQRAIYVRSEVDPSTWLLSSVARELEFVNSHTVHHHALIAEKVASFGIAVTEDFGVAPSTLEYRKTMAA
jgi:hypothetical protein